MLRSFEVQNFRLFRELHLKDLQRVNLIAGKNSCGKSALLEALLTFLGRRNPMLAANLNARRGLAFSGTDAVELWGWIFRERAIAREVKMKGSFDNDVSIELRISLQRRRSRSIGIGSVREEGVSEDRPHMVSTSDKGYAYTLEWDDPLGERGIAKGYVEDGKIQVEPGVSDEGSHSGGIMIHTGPGLDALTLEQFSQLESQNRQDVLIKPLQHLESRLKRLAILTTEGQPTLCGDVGLPRLVPIGLMGEGMSRLLRIVTAIAVSHHRRVLIDEIENGLHHSVLGDVWKAINEMSRESNTQVFATTHSLECIQAAHAAFSQSDSYDLALYRLDRIKDDIKVVRYDRETLETSVDQNMEVR